MTSSRFSTAGLMKRSAARLLTSSPVGWLLGTVARNRIPYHGLRYNTEGPVFTSKIKAQLFWETYEGAEARYAKQYLAAEAVVVELGSSIGITAALLTRTIDPGGRLLCVEANPELISTLRSTLSDHKPPGVTVDIANVAVADCAGEAYLGLNPPTGSSLTLEPSSQANILVNTVSLGDLLSQFGIRTYSLMLDIEGAESLIVGKEAGVLTGCRKIVAELHDSDISGLFVTVEELVRRLQEIHGFRVVDQHGPVFVLESTNSGYAEPKFADPVSDA
jgi:FkbM family methyltransferase